MGEREREREKGGEGERVREDEEVKERWGEWRVRRLNGLCHQQNNHMHCNA